MLPASAPVSHPNLKVGASSPQMREPSAPQNNCLAHPAINGEASSRHVVNFKRRRAAFAEVVGEGLAIVPTAREHNLYPYRPDSYFRYLTGFSEPEAVLVIAAGRSILFCREKDAEREAWTGFRYGPAAAREVFGFDEALPIDELKQKLPELIRDHPALWFAPGMDSEWDISILAALKSARDTRHAGKGAPARLYDWRDTLDVMRMVKDDAEIALMRKAAEITAAGHLRAMRTCRPGMMEYELEAEISHEFRRLGAGGHAYSPIVAGGANACVLHYTQNDCPLDASDLVLIDAGCEYDGYAADITRTFPVNGRFTAIAKDCYEIVLAAQQAAIAATAPNVPLNKPHEAAVRILAQGMLDLGLLTGEIDGVIESQAYRRFYMHNTGHWLGLDVHDVGLWKQTDAEGRESWPVLLPGMVMTVEPGLYIAASPELPDALASGIGIRIEDDVLVTNTGAEVYTHAPRSVTEIEEIMRTHSPDIPA
ncbi:MAG: aminopeptidase P N-terminal domain-containing protein [Betaproteobacteria bacterium]|nr:aminopeptidase P N-terminal domain-containing protein [Betaproteobacteria bacterium]